MKIGLNKAKNILLSKWNFGGALPKTNKQFIVNDNFIQVIAVFYAQEY